ncbi:hypothetical protein BGZ98_007196 [Dissophora globulifera]|nr:hypothetical protein BGZ98_007196 [Dissophora globulifera]
MSHFLATLQPGPRPAGVPFPEYYDLFMDWKTPFALASLYCLMVTLWNPKEGKVSRMVASSSSAPVKPAQKSESGSLMTAFVFVHNVLLCLYSALTFYNVAPALVHSYRTHSFYDALCDTDHSFWDNALGYWGYIFYLSKYYEVIDTIIILLKGRRSSLLQTYHHAGAMITMWSGIKYQANPIWLFVVLNSFIHTIMYCYYACTSIGLHPPGKKYLTSMQISQFLIGMSVAMTNLVIPGCVVTHGAQLAVWVNVAYLFPLTYLFVDFARRTYSKRGGSSSSSNSGRVSDVSSASSASLKKSQ